MESKIANVGVNLEIAQTDKERKVQEEEDLCTSIIKGLARRNRVVKSTQYWQRLEEKTKASCALMTSPAKNCCGMVDTNKTLEEEVVQIRSRIVAREFESEDRPDLYAGTPPMEASRAVISISASHEANILNHAHRRFTCILSCKSSGTCAGPSASGRQNRHSTLGKVVCWKRVCTAHGDTASNKERAWQEHIKSWRYQLGLSSKNFCASWEAPSFRNDTHGDDFVFTGPTDWLTEFKNIMTGCIQSRQKSSVTGQRRASKHWAEVCAGESEELCTSTVPDMSTCSWMTSGSSTATPCKHQQRMTWQKKSRSRWIKFNTAATGRKLQDVCSSVKPRSSRHYIHRARVALGDVTADTTEPCQVEEPVRRDNGSECSVKEEWSKNWRHFQIQLGSLQRNPIIIKWRRDVARQSHPKRTHTQATCHCKKQRWSRAVCCSIGRVCGKELCRCWRIWVTRCVGHWCEGHRTHPPKTRDW